MQTQSDTIIETTSLVRRFPGTRTQGKCGSVLAVDRLDLRVPAGSVYAFLGPNGAGKTTTIRMLLGLIRPDAGQVRLFGELLNGNRTEMLGRVGALVETPGLYPHLTGRENLEVTRRMAGLPLENIDRALVTVGMEGAADRLVRGYSMGMRQRLGLALALLAQPALLILDEPTNGLDPAGIHEMRDLITRLPREFGITVFLSSHLLSEVEQVATHLGIIREGQLLFQGELAELHARSQAYLSLGVDRPEEARRALAGAGLRAEPHGSSHLRVEAYTPEDAALANACLVERGFRVSHLSLEQPSLEDIFLSLTRADEPPAEIETAQPVLIGAAEEIR